jgi:TRAP-type C4-dicarboxylate transport system permease small subunit
MTALRAIASRLGQTAEVILALILGSLFVTFLIQIAVRDLLNLPLGWTSEYVAVAWLWGILFGYAFVVREAEVIRLDILYTALPRGPRRGLDIATSLICAGIFAWTLPKVWGFVSFMAIEKTAFMHIPFNWVFAIYIPFAVSVILRCLITAWQAATGSGTHRLPAAVAGAHDYD